MEDKEIIRLFKGLGTELGSLRYEMALDRQRIAKLERLVKGLLRRS